MLNFSMSFELAQINSISCLYFFKKLLKDFFFLLLVIKGLTKPKFAKEH